MCPFRGTPAPTHPGVYLLHQGRQQFCPDSRTKVTLRIRGWGQSTVWRGLLATPPGFCSPEPGVGALFCVPCTCGVTGPGPGGPAFIGDSACTGPPRRHTSQGQWRGPQGRVSPRAKFHTHFTLLEHSYFSPSPKDLCKETSRSCRHWPGVIGHCAAFAVLS